MSATPNHPNRVPHASDQLVRLAAAVLLAIPLAACDGGGTSLDESNERLDITNTSYVLAQRLEEVDEDVEIESGQPAGLIEALASDGVTFRRLDPGGFAPQAVEPVRLWWYRQILPPRVEGQRVQATSVALDGGDKAMVSYNMRGAARLGAIDWITNLTSFFPRIRSTVKFNDSDISAVATDGSFVYAAAATESLELPFPAVLERIALVNDRLRLRDNKRVAMTSFAATSVMRTSDAIWATSGDGGEVLAVDKEELEFLGSYPLDDARWVTWDKDGEQVIVVQGTPGRISVFADDEFPGGSLNLLDTFPFPGADVPESKSTAEVAGDKLYIAAGPEGVQIMCLADGSILGSIPRPDPASLGLDPSVVVTNSVTVDEDLMFISNGEAGVYVARGEQDFEDTGCDPPEITVLGRLRFFTSESANHVAHANDHLFIAAGLGGVKVVRVFR